MNELEKTVEAYFNRQIIKLGGISFKFSSPARRGVPDRIAILPEGRVYFVEIKRDEGVLTALQERAIAQINAVGANALTVYGKTGVDEFIQKIKKV